MPKSLIIYYSRKGENYVNGRTASLKKGNTAICAEFIQREVGGDLFEIEAVKEYPANYLVCTEEAAKEFKSHARPELKRYLSDIEGYDAIFVCGPCWWGTFPMPVFSLLDRLDLSGKKLLPLMTHEGSGLGHCVHDLLAAYPQAQLGKGLAVQGVRAASSEKTVRAWARNSLGK